jgi:aminoglycoside phosphotransferase (APT) family kinase protein
MELERLEHWLHQSIPCYRGPLQLSKFSGGQSNPTYELHARSDRYVLRKKPSGILLRGAHAIEREVQVMRALHRVGVPVPYIHALCDDESVIGTPFYVMEYVPGTIFWEAHLPAVDYSVRPKYFEEMVAVLASIHRADIRALGLESFGRAGDYFARQIKRWSGQYLADPDAGRDPNMDALLEWLPQNAPPDSARSSVIHGDFRCDNLVFDCHQPRIRAVLDWELSTLGDPLADFTYHAMMYRMPPHVIAGLYGLDLAALNVPSERTYISAYCAAIGLGDIPNYQFYMAFNFFRLAAIFHGIRGRMVRGTASSSQAETRARHFSELARLGWLEARSSS